MKVLGSLLVYLLMAVSGLAASNCKVYVVFRHPPKQVEHFEKILAKAEAGEREAQFQTGLAYETGLGVDADPAEAVRWYAKAANQGGAAAQNNLGGMYLRGLGVAQNDEEAFLWYQRAAAEGYLPAQNNLGFMHA